MSQSNWRRDWWEPIKREWVVLSWVAALALASWLFLATDSWLVKLGEGALYLAWVVISWGRYYLIDSPGKPGFGTLPRANSSTGRPNGYRRSIKSRNSFGFALCPARLTVCTDAGMGVGRSGVQLPRMPINKCSCRTPT